MTHYVAKPASLAVIREISQRRAHAMRRLAMMEDYSTDHGETEGREVHDDGSWSEDQPTGVLNASGDMIYRCARAIGFRADN